MPEILRGDLPAAPVNPRRPPALSHRARRGTVERPHRSVLLTVMCALVLVYSLIPLVWMVINATKTQNDLLGSFGLWFSNFALWDNVRETLTYNNGIFVRWLANTVLYVVLGAGGATFLAVLGGYGLSKFRFPGKRAVFAIVIGAVAVPGTALAVPTFLMFSRMGLTNTPWSVIIPSLISPFGLYLMWTSKPLRSTEPESSGRSSRSACRCSRPGSSPCSCSPWSPPGTTTSCR
jgi:multiple sugar transport system permease protein